jgi:MFS family permease
LPNANLTQVRNYRGYRVLAAVFVAQMLTIGLLSYGFGIFVRPVSAEFHLSRAEMNMALIIILTCMAVSSPFVGYLIDRYSAKYIMGIGAISFGICACGIAIARSVTVAALLLIPLSLCAVTISHVMTSALVSRWFFANRGRALGIAAISGSMSGVVVVPLLAWLVATFGWRTALFSFGVFEGTLVAVLAILFVASRPSDLESAGRRLAGSAQDDVSRTYGVRDLVAARDFWCIALATGMLIAVDQALLASLVPYGQERGMGVRQASFLITIIASVTIVGKVGSGYLCDRIDKRWLLWIAATFTTIFMAILASGPSDAVLYLGCATVGMAIGGTIPVWYAAVAHRFGTASYGMALGLTVLVHLPLQSSVVWLTGRIHDQTGSYHNAFFVFAALAVVASLVIAPVQLKPSRQVRQTSGFDAKIPI